MLALGVVTALRHAIGSFSANGGEVELAIPATPEAILRAVVNSTSA
jgi:xanthine dehydrogenase large subunit